MYVICDACGDKVVFENGRCTSCGWILEMNEKIAEAYDEEDESERFIGIPYDDYI